MVTPGGAVGRILKQASSSVAVRGLTYRGRTLFQSRNAALLTARKTGMATAANSKAAKIMMGSSSVASPRRAPKK